jgi:hypothetical protein
MCLWSLDGIQPAPTTKSCARRSHHDAAWSMFVHKIYQQLHLTFIGKIHLRNQIPIPSTGQTLPNSNDANTTLPTENFNEINGTSTSVRSINKLENV